MCVSFQCYYINVLNLVIPSSGLWEIGELSNFTDTNIDIDTYIDT